jgi:hypothetical protein
MEILLKGQNKKKCVAALVDITNGDSIKRTKKQKKFFDSVDFINGPYNKIKKKKIMRISISNIYQSSNTFFLILAF